MSRHTTSLHLLVSLLLTASLTLAQDAAQKADGPDTDADPPRLNLPEWNPDPEDLPPELRPLDLVRPELPDEAAAEVAELEARIAELERLGLTAETREEQDAALDEAIELAERVLAIRVEHQGNAAELVRWHDAEGEASEWHEVVDARLKVADLRLLLGLDDEARAALASIAGTDAVVGLLYRAGRYAEAQVVMEHQLAVRRHALGDVHLETLRSMSNMGRVLVAQGNLTEAEQYFREAMDGSRRVLGDEHPQMLIFVNNMGYFFSSCGKYAESADYYRRVLEGRRRVLGDEHPDTLICIINIGSLLMDKAKYAEALPYLRKALEKSRRMLGSEHPNTLISINNIGGLHSEQGRFAEAEAYFREALESSRRILGNKHPNTLLFMSNISGLLRSQGRFAEAELYRLAATEGLRRALGDDHPYTFNSINSIGILLSEQGRYSEAEPYLREALEIGRRELGDGHPQTLTFINNMGALLLAQGRLAEAEPYYREALEGRYRVLGDAHPGTLTSINNMGILLESQGRLAEAEPYYREALEGRYRVLGDAHPGTLTSINNMGILLQAQGKLAESEAYYREALAIAERLRVDVIGDAQARAQFAGALNLPGIAAGYARTLLGLDRAAEALGALERGRGRAGLDLFAGGRSAAEEALRAAADTDALARYDAALVAEEQARRALFEAEARLSAAPDKEKPKWTQRVRDARRAMNERTAAVFNELRGLVPAVDPLNTERMIAALQPGEALLTWSWADDGVIALVARAEEGGGGDVRGVTLAADRDETKSLVERINALRDRIAARPAGGDAIPSSVVASARDAALPKALRELLAGATSVIAVTDGPLSGVPVELLLPETPVAYAPSATIALRPRLSPRTDTTVATSAGVVLGDPVFVGQPATQPGESDPDPLLALAARSADAIAAGASALEQVRFYGGGLTPLPNTRLEAAAVAAMLGDGAALLLGAEATAPHLRAAVEASPPRVLHLATHGLLGSSDRPLLASLALTTPDEPTTDDIGFVTLGDILATWGAQLRGTALVVLSACDTAHGVRQGDTMMAMPLGLLICGADTVVASLWKVDDRATALLMARFYANWLGETCSERVTDGVRYSPGEPLPKLAALREAQSWLRSLTAEDLDRLTGAQPDAIAEAASRGPSPRRGRLITQTDGDRHPYDHPYYWAAFVLYGSPE